MRWFNLNEEMEMEGERGRRGGGFRRPSAWLSAGGRGRWRSRRRRPWFLYGRPLEYAPGPTYVPLAEPPPEEDDGSDYEVQMRQRDRRRRDYLNRAIMNPLNLKRNRFLDNGEDRDRANAIHFRARLDHPDNAMVTSYMRYNDRGGPQKRVDVTGAAHGGVATPHVLEYSRDPNQQRKDGKAAYTKPTKNAVRPARPWEVPDPVVVKQVARRNQMVRHVNKLSALRQQALQPSFVRFHNGQQQVVRHVNRLNKVFASRQQALPPSSLRFHNKLVRDVNRLNKLSALRQQALQPSIVAPYKLHQQAAESARNRAPARR